MEYATNGSFGSTKTAYSFGVQRESFVETTAGMGAGAAIGGMTYQSSGTYYYTGTGSVANVTGSATNQSYTYTADGSMTTFAMNASATGASGSGITGTSTLTTNPTAYGTYGVYGYNGEYTHTSLGLQYLRARYLNVATGTFISKDTYAGRLQDILSQNRYTYAENNPVGNSDPSGHAVTYRNKQTRGFNQQTTMSTAERARQATQNSVKNYAQTQRLKNMTTTERAISATQNSINSYIKEKGQSLRPNVSIPNVGVGRDDIVALQWSDSVTHQIEQRMCAAYGYCTNEYQESIRDNEIESVISVDMEDVNRWIQDIKEKNKDKNGTYTIGLNLSLIPAIWQFDGTLGISFDRKGNVAIQQTTVGGVTVASAPGTGVFVSEMITNAPDVYYLNGDGTQIGGSFNLPREKTGIPITVGADYNILGNVNDDSDKYHGITTSIGSSVSLEDSLGEIHVEWGTTETLYSFNLFDWWDAEYSGEGMKKVSKIEK